MPADGFVIEGTTEVVHALQRLSDELGDPQDALDQIGALEVAELRRNAPRRTGRLRASIRQQRARGRALVTAGNATVDYAAFPAYGTRETAPSPWLRRTDAALEQTSGRLIDHHLDRTIRREGLS